MKRSLIREKGSFPALLFISLLALPMPLGWSMDHETELLFWAAFQKKLPNKVEPSSTTIQLLSQHIKNITHLTVSGRIHEALNLAYNSPAILKDALWTLPRLYLPPAFLTQKNAPLSEVAQLRKAVLEMNVPPSAGFFWAVYPYVLIEARTDTSTTTFIPLDSTSSQLFEDLKRVAVLLITEELAHALQHQSAQVLKCSRISTLLKDHHVAPWDSQVQALAMEADVYAFLIEQFGQENVPLEIGQNHPEARQYVDHFFNRNVRKASKEAPLCRKALQSPQQRR